MTNDELTELEKLLSEPDLKCTHSEEDFAWICSSCRDAMDRQDAQRTRIMAAAIPRLISALRELRTQK